MVFNMRAVLWPLQHCTVRLSPPCWKQVGEISRWKIFCKMFGGLRMGGKPGGSWLSDQIVFCEQGALCSLFLLIFVLVAMFSPDDTIKLTHFMFNFTDFH